MPDYTLTSPKWEGDIKLSYFDNGFIRLAEYPEVIDRESIKYFATHFPVHESQLEWFRLYAKGAKVTMIEAIITFDAFWDTYGKKAGSKELARQYWDGEKKTINRRPVTLTDRQDIMRIVKRYCFRYQGNKKEFQPLATTFLHERMWEAELESITRKNEVNLLNLFTNKDQQNG